MVLLGISTTRRRRQFHRHRVQDARARHVDRPPADHDLGNADRERRQSGRRSGGQPRFLPALDGPPVRHRILSASRRRPAAAVAAPVLDVRPPLGLRDRAAGDGHGVGRAADLLPPPAGRLFARWRCRPSRRWSLGFGVWVHHMFATGLPGLGLSFFSGASIIITVPSAVAVFAWLATIWTRPAGHHHRVPVLRLDDPAVRDRRRLGLHDRERAGRLAADRHLFRRRPPPLRADRDQRLPGRRRDLFLVSQDRPDG